MSKLVVKESLTTPAEAPPSTPPELGGLAGSALFLRIAESGPDAWGGNINMEKWSGTPWMVDAFTDRIESDRYRSIADWCREQFGPPAWPWGEKRPGAWLMGGVTWHGWTWIGFDTEDKLKQFEAQWQNND